MSNLSTGNEPDILKDLVTRLRAADEVRRQKQEGVNKAVRDLRAAERALRAISEAISQQEQANLSRSNE